MILAVITTGQVQIYQRVPEGLFLWRVITGTDAEIAAALQAARDVAEWVRTGVGGWEAYWKGGAL